MNKNSIYSRGGLIAWIIFITGILYYCYAYLIRVYPSVMQHDLLSHFHISAGAFGILTSSYYFAYAPMQLPVGVSVDKIGPRKSLIFASFISIIGISLFAYTNSYALAVVGRFLAGFGVAFAFVTALKLASTWLPKRYFATAAGAVTGSGMVAAIFTDMYLTHIVQTHGYRSALHFPIYIGIALFILIILLIRNKPKHDQEANTADTGEQHALSYRQLGRYLLLIMKNPQMWIIGLIGALLYLPSSVFLDVWGIPYLERAYNLSPESAALGVSVMLAGWILFSFLGGYLSDLFGKRKIFLKIATLGAAILASIILFVPGINHTLLFILLFLLGCFCGPHPISFTMSKENNAHKIAGSAVAFANFVIMMGGFFCQPLVGLLLNLGWHGKIVHGIHIYSSGDYTRALLLLPAGLVVAFILTLFLKETSHHTH